MQPVALTGEGVPVPEAKKIRPELAPEADRKSFDGDTHSLPERDVLEAVNHGLYIVVVHIKSDGPTPRYRRHPYFGLAAAQRRVDRARQDGRDAYLLAYELRAAGWVGEASE